MSEITRLELNNPQNDLAHQRPKTLCRLIPPKWASSHLKTREGYFGRDEIQDFNREGYNVYFWPNGPDDRSYATLDGAPVNGASIRIFKWCFVDFDLKSGTYRSIEDFILKLNEDSLHRPTRIVHSGNGCHAYWRVSDLTAMDYLRLNRRLVRHFNTDEATCALAQLMRLPGTLNTKVEGEFKRCHVVEEDLSRQYGADEMNRWLAPISVSDEEFCRRHYAAAYEVRPEGVAPPMGSLPEAFLKLCERNSEAKNLYYGTNLDRSKADYRLGHVLHDSGLSREDAVAVLCNTEKALERGPQHRAKYAEDIVEKVWSSEGSIQSIAIDPQHPASPPRCELTATSGADVSAELLIEEPPPLIFGLIESYGSTALAGIPGSKKSFLAIDMGLAIATGRPWLGRFNTRKVPVLYIAQEARRSVAKRVAVMQDYWGRKSLAGVANELYLLDQSVTLADDSNMEAIINLVRRLKAGLVIHDTFAELTPGLDENSRQDMGVVINRLKKISEATGTANLVVHHFGKDASKGLRGSSALQAHFQTVLSVEKVSDSEGKIRNTKQRDMGETAPINFRIQAATCQVGNRVIDSCVVLDTEEVDGKETLGIAALAVLEAARELQRRGGSGPVLEAELKAQTLARQPNEDTGKTYWYRGMKALKQAGAIEAVGKGLWRVPA